MMKTLGILAWLVGIPAAAFAQAAIAGSVSDPSGVPVPGVAVEATSDALIENTRTTMTDRAGRYRIENLRPGTNAVKYSNAKEISVHLSGGSDGLTLVIVDEGVGFDVNAAWGNGIGLVSMVERLEMIGGSLEIQSNPGAGTRLTATVPPRAMTL